jgi:hypothetical protein
MTTLRLKDLRAAHDRLKRLHDQALIDSSASHKDVTTRILTLLDGIIAFLEQEEEK